MKIFLKEFLPGDFPRILQLEELSYPPELRYSEDQLREALSDPEVLCYTVKTETEQLVGGCIFKIKRMPGVLLLMSLTVDPECRRLGIGTLMINSICHASQGMKLDGISLQIESSNTGGILFFEKYGFQRKREITHYLRENNPGLEMYFNTKPQKAFKIHVHRNQEPVK